LIIRAIIYTQEKERQRLAKDFHDSMIQQLSAIKFYISSTSYLTRSEKLKTILNKHGKASEIRISFYFNKQILRVKLLDNGKGFDNKRVGEGMGLQNVRSRIKSHNGALDIASNIGKGTCYKIEIPINK